MLKKLSIALALGFCLAGVAMAAEVPEAVEAPEAAPTSGERAGCTPGGSFTLASLGLSSAVPTAGGEITFGEQACCQSDPCPGWGGQTVSCCGDTCSGYSNRVWCEGTGTIYCPDACASNGICHEPCGSSDPDCEEPICECTQGASCIDDSDCDCNQGFGFCYKEYPHQIEGFCSCYF